MTDEFLLFLVLLQVKHWLIDFVYQSSDEIRDKKVYGKLHGIMHSLKHGIGTMLCVSVITGYTYFVFALVLGVVDFIVHYHVDWIKMNYGERDMDETRFWSHLGLDQMAHQLTYIMLAYMMF